MQIVTVEEIIGNAKKLNEEGKKWHFHILTPDCVYNKEEKFALVLENSSEGESYINYSETKQEEAGKTLLELLHGIKADNRDKYTNKTSSPVINKMVERARELTEKGIPWHHHALFSDCIFNDMKGKWIVMLEDPETNEVIKSITDNKPDADLQLIEPLFYQQKK